MCFVGKKLIVPAPYFLIIILSGVSKRISLILLLLRRARVPRTILVERNRGLEQRIYLTGSD